MGSYSAVACNEVHGTYSEDRSYDSWTVSVQLRCTWANRYALQADLLGNLRQHPDNPYLRVSSVSIAPELTKYTASGQQIEYEYAIATVNYAVPGQGDEDQPDDPVDLISESLEPYTEVLTMWHRMFRWASDGQILKEGEEPGKIIHGMRLNRTMYYVTYIDQSILSLPGSVHDVSYYSPTLNLRFEANTLLFIPPTMERTITTAGVKAWTLKLSWDYKEAGWNKVWRLESGQYETVNIRPTGAEYKSYPEMSHAAFLF